MKSVIYTLSGALVALALSAGAPDAWAQHHGGGGGGGGTRTPSGGSSGGGGTAVSRGSGGSSGGGGHVSSSGGGSTRPSGSGGGRTASAPASSGGTATARPRGDRPNAGNPVIGQAAQRPNGSYSYGYPGYNRRYGNNYWYYPYNPYYLYGYGAFGLGAFYYDPFWWGYGYPYGYGYGYPGYYGGGYYGGYYGGGSSGGYDAPQPQADEGPKGGIKLKIQPENAEVFVDGSYAGIVDDFNSPFQRLNLPAGNHRIEVRANGFQTLSFDVRIEPLVTTSYSATLQQAR